MGKFVGYPQTPSSNEGSIPRPVMISDEIGQEFTRRNHLRHGRLQGDSVQYCPSLATLTRNINTAIPGD